MPDVAHFSRPAQLSNRFPEPLWTAPVTNNAFSLNEASELLWKGESRIKKRKRWRKGRRQEHVHPACASAFVKSQLTCARSHYVLKIIKNTANCTQIQKINCQNSHIFWVVHRVFTSYSNFCSVSLQVNNVALRPFVRNINNMKARTNEPHSATPTWPFSSQPLHTYLMALVTKAHEQCSQIEKRQYRAV